MEADILFFRVGEKVIDEVTVKNKMWTWLACFASHLNGQYGINLSICHSVIGFLLMKFLRLLNLIKGHMSIWSTLWNMNLIQLPTDLMHYTGLKVKQECCYLMVKGLSCLHKGCRSNLEAGELGLEITHLPDYSRRIFLYFIFCKMSRICIQLNTSVLLIEWAWNVIRINIIILVVDNTHFLLSNMFM